MNDIGSLNRVILVGRLGGSPELRYIPQTDRAVANFSLATNEKKYNPNSEDSEIITEWHRIVVWGKQAEFCEKYLDKGKQVLVEGKLRTEEWQDREGNKRTTTKIYASNIILLGKKGESGEPQARTQQNDDDEVPF